MLFVYANFRHQFEETGDTEAEDSGQIKSGAKRGKKMRKNAVSACAEETEKPVSGCYK